MYSQFMMHGQKNIKLIELVRFAERQNLVSARVPSHFKRILLRSVATIDYCLAHVELLNQTSFSTPV